MCPIGLCLKSILSSFNVLKNSLKRCYSLLTWVSGLGQGASSRDPHLNHKSCYQEETEGGGMKGLLHRK